MSFDPQSKKLDPMRCIDQAATAVAALHAGFAIMPLSITAPRSDGWCYRDEIAAHINVEKLADRRWLVAMLGAGSTAHHIFAEALVRRFEGRKPPPRRKPKSKKRSGTARRWLQPARHVVRPHAVGGHVVNGHRVAGRRSWSCVHAGSALT
jgi:hypothetical protein